MAWVRLALIAAACVAVVLASEDTSYAGNSVQRIIPQTAEQTEYLRNYLESNPELDVWQGPSRPGRPLDVRVNPDQRKNLDEALTKLKLTSTDYISDVQTLVEEQAAAVNVATRGAYSFGWDSYHRLDKINDWMSALTRQYPDKVSHITAGESFQGRKIRGVKISFGKDKPIVIIESGVHAREWITPATATFIINQVLTNTDASFQSVVSSYEWHVFPSTNPDGYEYTFTNNRMWRKTRSYSSGVGCYGTDANRNWPFRWNVAGSSRNPCSESYSGPFAASEKEVQGLKAYLDAIANRTLVYISLHSYSQLLMFPWGYTSDHAATYDELNEVGTLAGKALKRRYNTEFEVGPIADTIYPAAGTTVDYAYDKGVPFAFAFELRDQGRYGFLLPADQIIPAAEETLDAFTTILSEAKSRRKNWWGAE